MPTHSLLIGAPQLMYTAGVTSTCLDARQVLPADWTAMASLVLDIYMHFLPAYQR